MKDNSVYFALIVYNIVIVLTMVTIIIVSILLTGQFYGLWALLMMLALGSGKSK